MRRNRGKIEDATRWFIREALLLPSGLDIKHLQGTLQRMVVLYYQMYTHRGTLGNIVVFLISVAGILSSFVRYQYLTFVNTSQIGAAVYSTVWVTVLFSSCTCVMLYLRLLYNCGNILKLWMHGINYMHFPAHGLFAVVILNSVLGVYAVTVLRADMLAVAERVEAMDMHRLWRTIFTLLYYSRIFQRFLECLFMTLVFPVAKLWADTTPIHIKECTVQLLPWRTFHLFQRCLLFMTLILPRDDYRSSWFHLWWVVTQLYIVFCTAWLSMLALYSCTGVGSTWLLIPSETVSPSEERGNDRVVTGRSLPKVAYSERSPLIVSGTLKRFGAAFFPERQPTKTVHQCTISEEPAEQKETLAEKFLKLENEAVEAMPAPWPTEPSAQQPVDEEYDRHLVFQEAVEETNKSPSQNPPIQDIPADSEENTDLQGLDEVSDS